MMVDTLYEYYATQNLRPTYAGFDGDNELSKYLDLRKNIFYRLMLPPEVFDGKRLLEFGPDTGENSLVFAKWGAQLTLVEPNAEAHPYIRKYFSKFKLDDCLDDIVAAPLLKYQAQKKFDVIDAEGFIYTIQPNSAWIKKTGDLLEREGFLIISYMEKYGGFIELLTKAIYQYVLQDPAYAPGLETAKRLFLPKWNTVQHTRQIESWFMDVIENPFVRKKYYIDSINLLKDMHFGGFRLYSSWPSYRDFMSMEWIKATLNQEEKMNSSISFIEQSRLSHMLGSKFFLPRADEKINQSIASLVQHTDELIDRWSPTSCVAARACITSIIEFVDSYKPALGKEAVLRALEILNMVKAVLQIMEKGSADQLVDFCRADSTFLSTWGSPNHYAIYQRIE